MTDTVVRLDRGEFLREYWDYSPGEHVTILAPTGGGKTHLGYQLLAETMSEDDPAIVFVMKPRDATVEKFAKRLRLRIVREWPPPVHGRVLHGKPRGWVLWPAHSFRPRVDQARHSVIFERAILDSYRRGHRILFADETFSLEEELGLTQELRTVWTKGRSMECGLWAASQRPAFISLWAYQAHHLFLGNDPDERARARLAEIGAGVDKGLVRATVGGLEQHEFLYINRDERTMCVISS